MKAEEILKIQAIRDVLSLEDNEKVPEILVPLIERMREIEFGDGEYIVRYDAPADDAVAEDFVNEHASDDNYANPYDQENDPVDADNADRVLSGSNEYDKYVKDGKDSIVDKINELISSKSEGEDDDNPYANYPTMKAAADQVLADEKTEAKNDIDDAAEKAIADVLDGKDEKDATPEEQALIDDIRQAAEDANKAIDGAKSVEDVDKAVDDAQDAFDDAV